jgi:hypothetical protein
MDDDVSAQARRTIVDNMIDKLVDRLASHTRTQCLAFCGRPSAKFAIEVLRTRRPWRSMLPESPSRQAEESRSSPTWETCSWASWRRYSSMRTRPRLMAERSNGGDEVWLRRHHWWLTTTTGLSHGEASTALDG